MKYNADLARARADGIVDALYYHRARVIIADQAMVLDPAIQCPVCRENVMVAGPMKEDTGGPNLWVKLTCQCPGYVGTHMKVDRP